MPRIIRKPVPQISTCSDCGQDFKYMRTLGTKKYCERCDTDKRLKRVRACQARKKAQQGPLVLELAKEPGSDLPNG